MAMLNSPLRFRTAELGLAALVSAADDLLTAIGRGVGDERVSGRPDARTLRYYQTLGILDKPARYDGREAIYGYRHLLQAVVTKLLQAEGLSLAQVQRALAGRTTDALEAAVLEALPGSAEASSSGGGGGGASPPATPPLALVDPLPHNPPATPTPAPRALVTREVAPGVLITIDPRIVPDPETVLARIERAVYLSTPGVPR
jgi:DNA-binding transcriptional MerR regulator